MEGKEVVRSTLAVRSSLVSESLSDLTDRQRDFLRTLQAGGFISEDAKAGNIVRRLVQGFDLLGRSWDSEEAFIQAVMKLDAEDADDVRFFPIVRAHGRYALGVNLLSDSGAVLHLQMFEPPDTADPIPQVIAFYENRRYALLRRTEFESERLALRERLPIPKAFVRKGIENARQFLEETVPQLEELLLDSEITFEKLLWAYPTIYAVLGENFPEEIKNWKNIIPLNASKIVLLINQMMQELFRQRYMTETEGIADFSQMQIPATGSETGVIQKGPLTVKALLRTFLEAVSFAKREARVKDTQKLRFVRPPLAVFGEWLRNGAKGPLGFDLAEKGASEVYSLGDGALVFDVDNTLLGKGTDFSDPSKAPVLAEFVEILEMGIPVVIISGNSALEQYERILAPLEEMVRKGALSSKSLENLQMFTSTGSVRLFYDLQQHCFVKDAQYDVNQIMGDDQTRASDFTSLIEPQNLPERLRVWFEDLLGVDDLRKQGQQLIETARAIRERPQELTRLCQGFSTAQAVWEDLTKKTKGAETQPDDAAKKMDRIGRELIQFADVITAKPENFFAIHEVNFGGKITKMDFPFYIEVRDGVSAAIKGEGFRYVRTKSGVSLREAMLAQLRTYSEQNPLYQKFNATLGGETSMDITFRKLTKASAALYVLDTRPHLQRDEVIYWGDEFFVRRGNVGNDMSLRDPRLRDITLVHVGMNMLERTPHGLLTLSGQVTERSSEGDVLYILDSLDGSKEWEDFFLAGRPRVGHSYTVGAFYYGYPIFSVTYFPGMKGEKFLISHLDSPQTQKLNRSEETPRAYLPISSRDFNSERALITFLRLCMGSLEEATRPGSFYVRELVDERDPLRLYRQGHAPKSKLGILAHAFLRGAKVVRMTGDERGFAGLFPLDRQRLLDGSDRYWTAYAYFPWSRGALISAGQFEDLLRASRGENVSLPLNNPLRVEVLRTFDQAA